MMGHITIEAVRKRGKVYTFTVGFHVNEFSIWTENWKFSEEKGIRTPRGVDDRKYVRAVSVSVGMMAEIDRKIREVISQHATYQTPGTSY